MRFALLAGFLLAHTCMAQSGPYTFAFVGVPLSDALGRVIDETDISLVYETSLVAGRTSFCKIENADAVRLLACTLKGTGLDFVTLSSGTFVVVNASRARALTGGVVGLVVDAETGSPLSGANVVLADAGTATNQDGRFTLTGLLPGPHRLSVSHVAYHGRTDSILVVASEARRLSIELQPRVILSAPVVVSAIEPRAHPGEAARTFADLERVGPVDVVRTLGTLPGLRLGDVTAEVHLQGGAADEQQFLLDGAPVFVPVPSGGFISPFSPLALEQVTVRKAGFGASHGSHLSGVIAIEQHLGAERPQALSLHLDPINANGRWDGRYRFASGAEATWMAAGRKAVWDAYHPPQLETLFKSWSTPDAFLYEALTSTERPVRTDGFRNESGKLEVGLTDIHLAARVRFNSFRSLRAAFYRGASAFGSEQVLLEQSGDPVEFEDAYRWQNRSLDLRYEWVQSGRLLVHGETWLGDYALRHPVSGRTETEEFNAMREVGARVGGDLALAARHTVTAAIDVVHSTSDFRISLDPFGESSGSTDVHRPLSWRMSAFAEDRIGLTPSTTLETGLRATYVPSRQTVYAEPRIALRYDRAAASGVWSARAAAGIYRQFMHSFDVAASTVSSLLPRVRFWLPVAESERPPAAYHFAAALLHQPDRLWELGVEGYYKHQPHLLALNYGDTGQLLADARGYAYGAALTAARRGELFRIEAQYEWSVARRRIDGRFDGRAVAVPWSAPHRLVLELDVVPAFPLTLSMRGEAAFGRMWGFRPAYYDFLDAEAFGPYDFSRPEDHRLPALVRIDVGVSYSRRIAGVGLQGRLSFINLLGRRNINDWSLQYEEGRYVRVARYAIPFMPLLSLGVSI